MKQPNEILIALEALAAAFPWDKVQLNIEREPQGAIRYVVWISDNEKLGFTGYVHASANEPQTAVDSAIRNYAEERRPEVTRQKMIDEYKDKIAKLEAMQIGIPPYVPNRELAQFVGQACTATLDV